MVLAETLAVSAAFAWLLIASSDAIVVLDHRLRPDVDRHQLDPRDQRPAILAGDLLRDLVAVLLGSQLANEPAPAVDLQPAACTSPLSTYPSGPTNV